MTGSWRCRGLSALLAVACLGCPVADAAESLDGQPQQGVYRLVLGDFKVTALSDGSFDLDTRVAVTGITQERRSALLAQAFEPDVLPVSVNAFLIDTGDRLVLVDAGAAGLFGPTLGRLMGNLVAAGYRPEQIQDVFLTHLHADHVGGLVAAGQRAFPNATVHADRRDADYWMADQAKSTVPRATRDQLDGIRASLAPYVSADAFATFTAPAQLLTGVRAVPAPGHTPGHTIFEIESRGNKLVLWGDLMELASIQFVEASATIVYDWDEAMTASQRRGAYADAAAGRYLVGIAHLPFPGIGRVRVEPTGYSWRPVGGDVDR